MSRLSGLDQMYVSHNIERGFVDVTSPPNIRIPLKYIHYEAAFDCAVRTDAKRTPSVTFPLPKEICKGSASARNSTLSAEYKYCFALPIEHVSLPTAPVTATTMATHLVGSIYIYVFYSQRSCHTSTVAIVVVQVIL